MADSEWTITTLRELLENKIVQVSAKHDADIALLTARLDASDQALKLQAEANRVHFDALNHEGQRINDANAKNLNRDVYESDQKGRDEKLARMEAGIAAALPQRDFQTYKDSVNEILGTQTGTRRGVALSFATVIQTVGLIASVLTMLALIFTIMNGTHALPVSNPVTYIPDPNGQKLAAPTPQK